MAVQVNKPGQIIMRSFEASYCSSYFFLYKCCAHSGVIDPVYWCKELRGPFTFEKLNSKVSAKLLSSTAECLKVQSAACM